MKLHRFKRLLSLLLVAALLAGFYVPSAQAASTGLSWKKTDRQIRPDMTDRVADIQTEEQYRPSDVVRISIVLEDKPTIQAGYSTRNITRDAAAMAYNSNLKAKQAALANAISTQALDGKQLDVVWNLTLAANLISANVPYGKIDAIAQVAGVKNVVLETRYEPCVVDRAEAADPQMFASNSMTGSSLVWTNGYTGAGTRIAVIDTGTDTNHQSFNSGAFLYSLEQNAQAAGVSYEEYVESLDLLDQQEIASVLPNLNIYARDSSLTASKLYLNEKLPFAVNYVDGGSGRLHVDHEHDYQGEHGSHVAGIATANRYIPSGNSYADAMSAVNVVGAAPDAQLITMKVFGNAAGPYDSDYMSAIEDAIYLGCDSVNLSLGSGVAGTATNPYFADLLEYMTQTDTVVVASAGNSGSWADMTPFGYLYSQDVSLDTVGAPGSNYSFLSVASVENDGGVGLVFEAAGHTAMYGDTADGTFYALPYLDKTSDWSGTEYDFLFIDGLGKEEDYAGMDLTGKVVFCSRGETNFADKANIAVSKGAIATVVYNNQDTGIFGMNMTGYRYTNPAVSIAKADANAIRKGATKHTSSSGITYYTGKITIIGTPTGYYANSEYLTMSDFSSWGVPGDLSLKPEITAPGGNIYSVYGETPFGGSTDTYEMMSGTSMAAPSITGLAALMAQYLKESGLAEKEGLSIRTLSQSLLMSTAVPMLEEASGGNYYSILKQGAGLARVDLATSADSYILVDGQPDGKVKAELGDDPDRTGVYEFSFTLHNLTNSTQFYDLRADVFRQDVFDMGLASGQGAYGFTQLDTWTANLPATATFTVDGIQIAPDLGLWDSDLNGDGMVGATDADYLLEYLLGNETRLYGEGDLNGDGVLNTYDAHELLARLSSTGSSVMLAAGETVTVTVTLTLTESAKIFLDENYANGTYVEAYVYAESAPSAEGVAGTSHSIPVLAFYGNWSDPNMFDHSTYVELVHGVTDIVPYLYQVIGNGNALTVNYGDGGEYYFGGNPYVNDDTYLPERNAFNSENASSLVAQYFTLIRNAEQVMLVISNAETGEVYYTKNAGTMNTAFYYVNAGAWYDYEQFVRIGWTGTDANGKPLAEGTNVNVSLVAIPEYYRNDDGTFNYEDLGKGIYLTTPLTIDNTAPEVLDLELDGTTLTVTALDNEYVAAAILLNASGTSAISYGTPNQMEANTQATVELDLSSVMGESFLLAVYDYADNGTIYEITLELPEVERPYLTVVDSQTDTYYGIGLDGSEMKLVDSDRGAVHAVEFVDGYIFEIANGRELYVAPNSDLNNFTYLCNLDPDNYYGITTFCDLAYSYADNTLYGLFYCEANAEESSVLCTIDMFNGQMEVLGVMPVDVCNLAIDGEGNFYSVTNTDPYLYTYTLEGLYSGEMTYVGEVGYYGTYYVNSLAWDHNTDTLYWAFPNTLLTIDTETAEPTRLFYNTFIMVGLYVTPETYGNQFAPVNTVSSVTLNHTESRTLVGNSALLSASVWPWNVTDTSVVWSSSDTSVATVDQNGRVYGISAGTAIITATSTLDPTKSASCVFDVTELDKTLNALVWDESGDIWWTEFNVTDPANYTKLSAQPAADYLTSTAVMPDGTLYVGTTDLSTGYLESIVYTADPNTFDLTLVGASSVGYTDLAPAPHIFDGSMIATYGSYVLFVNPDDGDFYSGNKQYFQMFLYSAVGITYAGSTKLNETFWVDGREVVFDNYIDWYFIADAQGYIYLLGWIESLDGGLYYFEHPDTTGGVYSFVNEICDVGYFSSLYYDGEFLYYSCYNQKKNVNSLYAIDTMGDRKAYSLGDFGQGVWPASGLMELNAAAKTMKVTVTAAPKAAEATDNVSALKVTDVPKATTEATVSTGGLNYVAPASSGQYKDDSEQITVKITGVETSPNGLMTVTYDPTAMTFTGITGHAEAFAYKVENGKITIAFANSLEQLPDSVMAVLTFEPLKAGTHTVTVSHKEAWNNTSSKVENLTVEIPAKEEEYTTKWKSITTTLGGNIGLNFYAEMSANLVNNPDTFVRFILNGIAIDVPMAKAVAAPDKGENVYCFTCPITAKNMTDDVTAQVMVGDQAVGTAKTMDVATYCNWVIANYTDAKTVNLMKAMLNYGASAQMLFSYRTDDLANAALSEADKTFGNVDASAYAHSVVGTEDGIKATSCTLMLDSETSIRVYFQLTGSKTIDQYTFTVDGVEVTPVYKDGKYYIEKTDIGAHRLDDMHTFTCGGITITYGGLSYVNQVMNFSGSTAETVNMAKALFAYSKAAEAYIG